MSTPELTADLEEQRREIVGLAREVAQNEIAPGAAERDRTCEFSHGLLQKLGELGFFGMLIPEEYDGLELDMLTYLMVIEEFSAADASVAISLSVHNSLPARMLIAHGTDEQKTRWLGPMARGEVMAAFSLSEADSGSDAASLEHLNWFLSFHGYSPPVGLNRKTTNAALNGKHDLLQTTSQTCAWIF